MSKGKDKHLTFTGEEHKQTSNGHTKGNKTNGKSDTLVNNLIELHHFPCLLFVVGVLIAGEYLNMEQAKRFYIFSGRHNDYYVKHENDVHIVFFWVISFTVLRWLVQQYFLTFVAYLMGVRSKGKVLKFQEAGWLFLYYGCFVIWGYIIAKDEPYFYNNALSWQGIPQLKMTLHMKPYYLIQTAFWFHMIYVWLIEKKRKDSLQMIIHHIITVNMVIFSYSFNMTKPGQIVLLDLDLADLILFLTKLFNYAKMEFISNALFVVFTIVWFITRHIILPILIYNVWSVAGALELKWDPANEYYWSPFVFYTYMAAFAVLQTLIFIWFYMILKLIKRVLFSTKFVKDSRSDSDSDAEVEKESKKK